MDPLEYRSVMSRFAAGVTVISVLDPAGAPIGFTATAFCSVSLDPPLALVCVNSGSYAERVMGEASAFAVSVLRSDQDWIALRFADPAVRDRFAGVTTRRGGHGLPVISGSIGGVVCERVFNYEGGDHVIFVGRASESWATDGEPLLHFRGAFNELAHTDQRPSPAELRMSDWLVGAAW
ncbi:MAG: flavin reductase domain protein FMN-binding protein [Conexibacter sp.]|nr:flavin reductase domain protein FMN-binding protein [Conexibacter sp.]